MTGDEGKLESLPDVYEHIESAQSDGLRWRRRNAAVVSFLMILTVSNFLPKKKILSLEQFFILERS